MAATSSSFWRDFLDGLRGPVGAYLLDKQRRATETLAEQDVHNRTNSEEGSSPTDADQAVQAKKDTQKPQFIVQIVDMNGRIVTSTRAPGWSGKLSGGQVGGRTRATFYRKKRKVTASSGS